MSITGKTAKEMIGVLDDLRKQIKEESKDSNNSTEWERKREQVKQRLNKLPEYIEKAASMINVEKTRGPEKDLSLVQRTTLLLFTKLMGKSNRGMEEAVILLQPFFGVQVGYKTIERLYSDEEVKLVLHNLFILLLQDEGQSRHLTCHLPRFFLFFSK